MDNLIRSLERLRDNIIALERTVDLTQFGNREPSARNLLHYLAFRRFDLREMQATLARLGVSSLGRAESHVLANLTAALKNLYALGDRPGRLPAHEAPVPDAEQGQRLLNQNAEALLGPPNPRRGARIMVTMPTEAATQYSLVRDLVSAGMECMRINCAHDSVADWQAMIRNLRRAERETGRTCRILMDLAGPKIRTGPMARVPGVVRVRPQRDRLGAVLSPGRVWLAPAMGRGASATGDPIVPVDRKFLSGRKVGEVLRLRDARGAKRALTLTSKRGTRFLATTPKTTYLSTRLRIAVEGRRGRSAHGRIGSIPTTEVPILLRTGDRVLLTGAAVRGHAPGERHPGRRALAVVSITLPEVLRMVRKGEHIWFDDGHIGGVVVAVTKKGATVQVTHAAEGGSKLAGDKGINLPDTELDIRPLTTRDLADLEFVVRHADIVGYSFVHSADAVERLRAQLIRLGRPDIGVLLKIETRRAFDALPSLLLAALRLPVTGIMIARGDLAVEVGYERLAEVQEEALWLSEAAHLPAIWATQVLEGLTKSGLPSRAEVTDAAMGERAECVMLNKGPHVIEAVRVLDNILARMQAHQAKKTARLRHLNVAEAFFRSAQAAPRTRPVVRR